MTATDVRRVRAADLQHVRARLAELREQYRHPNGAYGPIPVEERFWVHVVKTDTCWLWAGRITDGYGLFRPDCSPAGIGKWRVAHRVAYEFLVGPIPNGLQLDHVKDRGCTSKACVKVIADEYGPAHLEPVTNRENILRGDSPSALNARKTHCIHGHPFDEANTYIAFPNRRKCRTCRRAASSAYEAKRPPRKTSARRGIGGRETVLASRPGGWR